MSGSRSVSQQKAGWQSSNVWVKGQKLVEDICYFRLTYQREWQLNGTNTGAFSNGLVVNRFRKVSGFRIGILANWLNWRPKNMASMITSFVLLSIQSIFRQRSTRCLRKTKRIKGIRIN